MSHSSPPPVFTGGPSRASEEAVSDGSLNDSYSSQHRSIFAPPLLTPENFAPEALSGEAASADAIEDIDNPVYAETPPLPIPTTEISDNSSPLLLSTISQTSPSASDEGQKTSSTEHFSIGSPRKSSRRNGPGGRGHRSPRQPSAPPDAYSDGRPDRIRCKLRPLRCLRPAWLILPSAGGTLAVSPLVLPSAVRTSRNRAGSLTSSTLGPL